MRLPVWSATLAVALASCGDGAAPTAAPAATPTFSVRGRWDDPRQLRYRIDDSGSPVAAARFVAAVQAAAAAWNQTGLVHLARAEDDPAALTLCWRRGHHGACEPFGPSTAIAHSGPVRAGSFIHFDAGHDWGAGEGGEGDLVFSTALHELGHLLGLGHSADPGAVMNVRPDRPQRIAPADLDGLRSLYAQPAPPGPDDVALLDREGALVRTLHGIAPAGRSAAALFDTTGDGRAELLVWRTDPQGHGALMAYAFGPGAQLVESRGPMLGATAKGAKVTLRRTATGDRLLCNEFPGGILKTQRFDDDGLLVAWTGAPADAEQAACVEVGDGDVDGDGSPEQLLRR